MCEVKTVQLAPGVFDVICVKSGKPITVTDDLGMWCEDRCDYEHTRRLNELLTKGRVKL